MGGGAILIFVKRIGNRIWAAWLHAWNAFDRLVYWYAIGDTQKAKSADGVNHYSEVSGIALVTSDASQESVDIQTSKCLPVAVEELDFTPVAQHLQSLSQNAADSSVPVNELRMIVQAAATVPKDLQYPESNEDAYAWDENTQRAAVFDGATESFAAERWVALVRTQWLSGHPRWLQRAREEYDRDIEGLNLSWAQLEAAERGSYTTLVSVESTSIGMKITTVGDSCIFLLEGAEIIACAPYVSQGEFFASPQALSTRAQDKSADPGAATEMVGDEYLISSGLLVGRQLLLATDALSQWLMVSKPQERLERFLAALAEGNLGALVASERGSRQLKTDDTTALLLTIDSGDQ